MDNPNVKRLARVICEGRGVDPDEMVPETGYPDSPMIPRWQKHAETALDFISMTVALQPR